MISVSKTGPAPYIYASTRMRVRKSKLLAREDYMRLLNMSLPEITRFIEETEYKAEIDELASSFSGIDLIEIGLSWNLANEYQRVLKILPGVMKTFARSYLSHWDIFNVLTILRGKSQGVKTGKIKEILIPAGTLNVATLDRLLSEDSPERIVENLSSWILHPVLEREFAAAQESGSYAEMENELYKAFYRYVLKMTAAGIKGGKPFRDYLRLEIDLTNIKTVIRLYQGGVHEDVRELMIAGGSFSIDELTRLAGSESIDEIMEGVRKYYPSGPVADLLEERGGSGFALHEMENALTQVMLEQMDRISRRYPFSICSTMVYLKRKRYEVANLRALARGKESGLSGEQIQGYLVM